jgi:hypothetical protein
MRSNAAILAPLCLSLALAACGGQPETAPQARVPADPSAVMPVPPATPMPAPDPNIQVPDTLRPNVLPAFDAAAPRCEPSPRMAVQGRASPYDSAMVAVGGQQLKVCYGRPSARGRTMLGGDAVPFGRLWRTGANEPTIVHVPFRARIAGMEVGPGSYSLYTIPGEREWTVVLNRSTSQWGHESAYTDALRAQEVGRAPVPAERTAQHVETFTIRGEPAGERAALVMEWEHARVRIPVERI